MRLTVRKLKTIELVFVGAAGVYNDPVMGVIHRKPHMLRMLVFLFFQLVKASFKWQKLQ
jgi:hypothetical protein